MKKKKINSNNLLLLITIVLFFVMYAAGCIVYADKGFTRFQTFLNILINNAGLICITAGMTCVMLTGGIDISVGSLVAMDCMILAVGIEQWGWSSPVLMLLILAIGIIFGIVQGFCISYLEIQPFIVTMAGMFFARGMTAVICKEQVSIVSDKIFTTLSSFKISLPFGGYLNKKGIMQFPYLRVTVVVALIVVIAIYLMLKYTRFGSGCLSSSSVRCNISPLLRSYFLQQMLCRQSISGFSAIAPFANPVGKWLSSRIHTFILRFLASSIIISMSCHQPGPQKSGCGRLSMQTALILLSSITFIYSLIVSSFSPLIQKNGKI